MIQTRWGCCCCLPHPDGGGVPRLRCHNKRQVDSESSLPFLSGLIFLQSTDTICSTPHYSTLTSFSDTQRRLCSSPRVMQAEGGLTTSQGMSPLFRAPTWSVGLHHPSRASNTVFGCLTYVTHSDPVAYQDHSARLHDSFSQTPARVLLHHFSCVSGEEAMVL